jgi:hypothetical protein
LSARFSNQRTRKPNIRQPHHLGLHYPYPKAIAKEQKDVADVAGNMMN